MQIGIGLLHLSFKGRARRGWRSPCPGCSRWKNSSQTRRQEVADQLLGEKTHFLNYPCLAGHPLLLANPTIYTWWCCFLFLGSSDTFLHIVQTQTQFSHWAFCHGKDMDLSCRESDRTQLRLVACKWWRTLCGCFGHGSGRGIQDCELLMFLNCWWGLKPNTAASSKCCTSHVQQQNAASGMRRESWFLVSGICTKD